MTVFSSCSDQAVSIHDSSTIKEHKLYNDSSPQLNALDLDTYFDIRDDIDGVPTLDTSAINSLQVAALTILTGIAFLPILLATCQTITSLYRKYTTYV